MLPTSRRSWRTKCPRCRVDRHDRCIGPMDCGCDDPAHEVLEPGDWDNGVAEAADAAGEQGMGGGLGQVHQLDPDAETVIIEMNTVLYGLLVAAGQLQDRDPGVVLRRALEHYLWGCGSGCRHDHDERPGGLQGPPEGTGDEQAPPVPLVADPGMRTEIPRP